MRILTLLVYFATLFCPFSFTAAVEEGAKAIFHTGEGPTVLTSSEFDKPKSTKKTEVATKEQYMGISYWIEVLGDDGKLTRVPPTKTFHSGDRIKLNIESNRDGYLYVLNIGSSGNSHILFPNPGVKSNLVVAGLPYAVPFKTFMRFDNTPGEELLLITLSPKPLENLSPSIPAHGPLDNRQTNQFLKVASAKGAKDLILENDVSGPSPATYAVAPMSSLESKAITIRLKLKHK